MYKKMQNLLDFIDSILDFFLNLKYFKFLKKYKRFFKYTIIGASAATIQIIVLLILTKIFYLHKDLSYIIAIETAILWAFLGHSNYTFKDRKFEDKNSFLKQILKFHFVNLTTIIGQFLLFKFLTDKIFNHYYAWELILSSLIAIITMFILNFILHYFFTFKKIK